MVVEFEEKWKKGEEKSYILYITVLLMWQPVKVVEWGTESVGVRVEPTTQVSVKNIFLNKKKVICNTCQFLAYNLSNTFFCMQGNRAKHYNDLF
jgi:hypothetical protein